MKKKISRGLLFSFCGGLTMLFFVNATPSVRTSEYEAYMRANLCTASKMDACFKTVSYVATRSDGRRVTVNGVYNYIDSNQVSGIPLVHFMLTHLRLLRNAAGENPSSYGTLLYNQMDYILSRTTLRGTARVWENAHGYAQGMEQMEYAAYFSSYAGILVKQGELNLARSYANVALQLSQSLQLPASPRNGGVRGSVYSCGSKAARARPCYWFHSRGLGISSEKRPYTVLNQNLHVIRDSFSTYLNLKSLEAPLSLDSNTMSAVNNIGDAAVGGLYHLAYSQGPSKSAPARLPALSAFMNRYEKSGQPFYWAFYEFNNSTQKMANISHGKTCHYHTHTLSVFDGIRTVMNKAANKIVIDQLPEGWKAYEAMAYLLQSANENLGTVESKNAIYQFYLSETSDRVKYDLLGCPKGGNEILPPNAFDGVW